MRAAKLRLVSRPLLSDTSASAAAAGTSVPNSSCGIDGAISGGRPAGTGPTTCTPSPCSPSIHVTKVATASANNAPGARGCQARAPKYTASVSAASAAVGQWMLPSCRSSDSAWPITSRPASASPVTLPSWLKAILMATPLSSPARIGTDRKSARKPSRNLPASTQNTPVSKVRETDSAR
ncbi:hypothetical protein D9M68_485190 [compost metagenome]